MSDANRTQDPGLDEARFATRAQGMWLLGLLVGAVVLLSLGGESARLWLRYDRLGVLDAREYWRLVTGHLVHGSATHMALNLAGLALLATLFPRHYSFFGWVAVMASSVAAIDVGFVLYEPQLEWYVGLSGVLHGALAAGAIAWWRYESRPLALILALILIVKLTWEQTQGALPLSGDMTVIVDAHLYGAIGGVLAGGLVWCGHQRWPRVARPL
jgi:rhomboid family GlyGly-CTERM serine protease